METTAEDTTTTTMASTVVLTTKVWNFQRCPLGELNESCARAITFQCPVGPFNLAVPFKLYDSIQLASTIWVIAFISHWWATDNRLFIRAKHARFWLKI